MSKHEKINYIEFPSSDLAATKKFFAAAFGWEFVDYGPEYTAFSGAGMDGGFYSSELSATPKQGSVLIVLYSKNLEETQRKIEATGGKVVKAIFSFPGGRRFHFVEPGGNELAVWGEDA
ncbi:MAG: VOC family protein [Gammaproteobacteria bacterium]|nr:VOC family protein [Gammaproteobacteria bacterium]